MNAAEKMTALCRQFPTLDKADGVEEWDPEKLDAWACGPAPCHGALYAARFVLSLWNGLMGRVKKGKALRDEEGVYAHRFSLQTPWKCGPFDVVDAMGTWDVPHRQAFLSWAKEPWWP